MAKMVDIQSREAKWGERMIEIKLRFWTNGIDPDPGKIVPKHAWASGVVRIERNGPHGIDPSKAKARPFNSLLDVGAVIEKVLIDHHITLHLGSKMRKYFRVD